MRSKPKINRPARPPAPPDTTGNQILAARAQDLAAQPGADRRACLVAAACLATTTTPAGAIAALADAEPDQLRDRAASVLRGLLRDRPPTRPTRGEDPQ